MDPDIYSLLPEINMLCMMSMVLCFSNLLLLYYILIILHCCRELKVKAIPGGSILQKQSISGQVGIKLFNFRIVTLILIK